MSTSRLDELLQSYIDARLTAAEREELERELLAAPEARREFWRQLQFEGQIQEVVEAQQVQDWMTAGERAAAASGTASTPERPRSWVPVFAWAASVAVAFALGFGLWPRPQEEGTSAGIAIFTAGVDVRWAADATPLEPGAILPPGRLRLDSGLIGLEFYGGARAVVQGPADLDLLGFDQLHCREGRLRVQVSTRARGFRVSCPALDLVDLGTEFGLDVGAPGRTELHVFDGRVVVAATRDPAPPVARLELAAGEAIRVDEGGLATLVAQPSRFAGTGELDVRLRERTRTRHAAWQETSLALRRDPRLVLYYDFEPASRNQRVLSNHSLAHGETLDGTAVGARWSEGRWPGKTALEFREPGDRVRTFVPGEYDTLTFVTWLRVDALDTLFSGIFLTDGFVKGAVHWQFHAGRLRLGLGGDRNARGRIGTEYDVEAVDPAVLLGRWRQVAVSIDMVGREIVHYLDGKPVKRAAITKPNKLVLGQAELGNWGLPDDTGSAPIRNFNGRMDEFMLFNAVLSEGEIAALYEQGRHWPPTLAGFVR